MVRSGSKPGVPKWPEVRCINDFAIFSGSLAMVIRGLGFLVVTWTTVVLLGGFVSVLQKKDFWSLTVITFIQIARVLNFEHEKWNSVVLSGSGLDAVGRVLKRNRSDATEELEGVVLLLVTKFVVVPVKKLLGWIAFLVQAATYMVVISCSFFVILILGPYIATGVSLWRLRQRDYGNVDGDSSKSNMNPALDVLYTIVVVQGAIFIYQLILSFVVRKKLVAEVVHAYWFEDPTDALVEGYMNETLRGCVKSPSFAKGRNLVTYAVDLMAPHNSPQDHLSGLRILSAILEPSWDPDCNYEKSKVLKEQHMLIRRLILYAPSSHIFRHLLVLANPRSCSYDTSHFFRSHAHEIAYLDQYNRVKGPVDSLNSYQREDSLNSYERVDSLNSYDREIYFQEKREKNERREISKHAASIAVHIADEASLEQLPQLIKCMSSLVWCTFQEHFEFFSMHPAIECRLESDYTREEEDYMKRLRERLHLLFELAADKNNSRLIIHTQGLLTKIMTLIASNLHHSCRRAWDDILEESLKLMHRLTGADGKQGAKLIREIGTNLEVEAVETMMRTISSDKCSRQTKELAMEILNNLSMQTETKIREDLIEKLADTYTYNDAASKIPALKALAMLCFQDGRNAVTILQVNGSAVYSFTEDLDALSDRYHGYHISVAEILHHACLCYTKDDECFRILKESMTDVMPMVLNKILTARATHGQSRSRDIQKIETALLSLCVTIHERFISPDQYLALQFDVAIDAFSLPMKLREMVVRNNDPTASCLKILMLISKMVISMIKCTGSSYPKQDLERLVEELSRSYSSTIYFIDSSMDFARGDDAAKTWKPERVWSFITEAMGLVHNYRA